MKRTLLSLFGVVFVLCFAYNANAIHDTVPDGTKVVEPGADAPKLYTYIMKPKPYYDQWKVWPGSKKMAPGREPHGSFVQTYVNKIALGSLSKGGEMADGSIIVHEEYDAQKKMSAITVMSKIKGYNPEAGDWFWVKYAALNGNVLESGKADSCIACHNSSKRNDYLFSRKEEAKGKL